MAEPSRYEDFEVSIWSEAGQYKAKVTRSPVGESEIVRVRAPFPGVDRDVLLLRLENAVLRGQGGRRSSRATLSFGSPMSKEEKVLREAGAEMFRIVFTEAGPISLNYARSIEKIAQKGDTLGLRVKLRIGPPELALLPWEYTYDEMNPPGYLCLQNRSPLVRSLPVPQAPGPLRVKGTLNILGMIANPGGEWEPLDTERERRRIDAAISTLQASTPINFRWVQGDTSEQLFDIMQQEAWHVFHFIGHGGIDIVTEAPAGDTTTTTTDPQAGAADLDESEAGGEGFIVLADGRGGAVKVSAYRLGLMLQGQGALRLAVLNCCESGRGVGQMPFSSAGASLVRSGVPVVVAMQFPITDEAAIHFAGRFYKSLAAGQPVEKALTDARVLMAQSSGVEWGIPVLFTRAETGPLFVLEGIVPSMSAPAPLADDASARQAAARAELRRLFH